MKKKQKVIRVTRYSGRIRQYYAEEHRTILRGLIGWWRPAKLPAGCWFRRPVDAAAAINNQYPNAIIEWHE